MQVGELTARLDIDMTDFNNKIDSAFTKLNEITLKMADAVTNAIKNRVVSLSAMGREVNEIALGVQNSFNKINKSLSASNGKANLKSSNNSASNNESHEGSAVDDSINNMDSSKVMNVSDAFANILTIISSIVTIMTTLGGETATVGIAGSTAAASIGGVAAAVLGVIVLAAAAAAAGAAGFVALYKHCEEFATRVNAFLDNIKSTYETVWDSIKTAYETTISGFKNAWNESGLGESFAELFSAIVAPINDLLENIRIAFAVIKAIFEMDEVKNIVEKVWGFILSRIKYVIDIITGIIKIFNALFKGDIRGTGEAIVEMFTSMGENIINILNKLWDLVCAIFGDFFINLWTIVSEFFINLVTDISTFFQELPGKMLEFGENILQSLVDGINEKIEIVREAISQTTLAVIEKIKELPTKMLEKGKEIIEKLVNGIKDKIETTKSAVSEVAQGIIDKVTEMPEKMLNFGKDIIQGLINGIKEKIQAVKDAIKEVTSAITDKVKGVLGIESPSKVMMEFGKYTGEGFVLGIKSTFSDLRKTAEQMGTAISFGVSNVASKSGYSYYYDAGTVQTFSPAIQISGGINSLEYRREVNRLMRRQAALIAR